MTVGQLIECVVGKAACFTGKFGDATPFDKLSLEETCDILQESGFQRRGYEVMYNGKTGMRINSMIFIGPTYYQRLKHMVQDKQHAIARGSMQNFVRQPIEGRSKNGGLRSTLGLSERIILLLVRIWRAILLNCWKFSLSFTTPSLEKSKEHSKNVKIEIISSQDPKYRYRKIYG